MRLSALTRFFALTALSGLTAGCGTVVPTISEPWDRDIPPNPKVMAENRLPATGQIEFEIKKRIYCDLREAVQAVEKSPYKGRGDAKPSLVLPLDWGAYISLSLQVDDSSAVQPGLSFIDPLSNAQSISYGFGGNLSSTATRIDKFDSFYIIKNLNIEVMDESICNKRRPENDPIINAGYRPAQSSPFIVESDLGIKDWLIGASYATRLLKSDVPKSPGSTSGAGGSSGKGTGGAAAGGGGTKPDTVTLEEKFLITTSGSFTPTWKLTRIAANTGNTALFSTGRVRTHDLIITVGPQTAATEQSNNNQQIGNLVSSGILRTFNNVLP